MAVPQENTEPGRRALDFVWILLAYFMLGPPVGEATLLALSGVGEVPASDLISAAIPLLLLSFPIGGAAAIFAGVAAAIGSRSTHFWIRLGVPLPFAFTGALFAGFVLQGMALPTPKFALELLIAGAFGSIVPGTLLELISSRRTWPR